MQEAQIHFQGSKENVKSGGMGVFSIGGITFAASLAVGLLYFAIKRKGQEDAAAYFSYKPMP